MSRPLRLPLRRTLHTTPISCARIQHPGELPSWGPTPPVNPLLNTPPKPVPSYRSPSSSSIPTPKAPTPSPSSGARLAEGEVAPPAVDEDDPYANFVAPQLTPRKDLWEEVQRQRREREAKQRHGNVYKELLPGMVIPLAIAFATYAVSRIRYLLASRREVGGDGKGGELDTGLWTGECFTGSPVGVEWIVDRVGVG